MNQNIYNKLELLRAYLGQLIDLKAGNINELVLTKKGSAVELLTEVVLEAIKLREEFLEMDSEMSKMEAEKIKEEMIAERKYAHCTKCGNRVRGNEDGMCGDCV